MAIETDNRADDESSASELFTGVVAGLAGAVVTGLVLQFGFNPTILSEGIPAGFGLAGLAAGWIVFLAIGAVLGLVYAALAQIDRLSAYATVPGSGASLGLVYGLAIWVLAVIVVPLWVGAGRGEIGGYAVNLRGVLSFALLGIIIGVVYGGSSTTE